MTVDSPSPNFYGFTDNSRGLAWISGVSLLFISISAAWLTFYNLGRTSPFLGEAHTWWFVSLGWREMLEALRIVGVHPPLYFLLEKIVVGLSGTSESGLRLLSALAHLFGLFFIARLGKRVGGIAGMLAGAWFWAFTPMTIVFSRDARPYALMAMLSAACLYFFTTAQENSGSRTLWLAGLCLGMGLITHYFFLLLFGVTLLVIFANLRRRRIFFRRWVLIVMLAILPLLAWLIWFLALENPSFGIGWIESPTWIDLPLTFWNLLSGYAGLNSFPNLLFGSITLGMVLVGLLDRNSRRFAAQWLGLGLLLPVAGIWLVSMFRPVYIDRYFLVLLPIVALLVSVGASRVWMLFCQYKEGSKRTALMVLFLLIFAASGFYSGWQVHVDPKFLNEDWRGLAAYLAEEKQDVPQIWFKDPEAIPSFEYYYSGDYVVIPNEKILTCQTPCWWIIRQPYTATHAFTQSITDPFRPWKPEIPSGCQLLDAWESDTQLALWQVQCK